jgi:hypothetical protein
MQRFFGEDETVWQGGFQISYDAFFNMISLFIGCRFTEWHQHGGSQV